MLEDFKLPVLCYIKIMMAGNWNGDSVLSKRQGNPVRETIHYRKQFSLPLKEGNSDIFITETAMGAGAQGIVKKLTCVWASNYEEARRIWNWKIYSTLTRSAMWIWLVSSMKDLAGSGTSLSAEVKGEDTSSYNRKGKQHDRWVRGSDLQFGL